MISAHFLLERDEVILQLFQLSLVLSLCCCPVSVKLVILCGLTCSKHYVSANLHPLYNTKTRHVYLLWSFKEAWKLVYKPFPSKMRSQRTFFFGHVVLIYISCLCRFQVARIDANTHLH